MFYIQSSINVVSMRLRLSALLAFFNNLLETHAGCGLQMRPSRLSKTDRCTETTNGRGYFYGAAVSMHGLYIGSKPQTEKRLVPKGYKDRT
jgi:hypothetical protein